MALRQQTATGDGCVKCGRPRDWQDDPDMPVVTAYCQNPECELYGVPQSSEYAGDDSA